MRKYFDEIRNWAVAAIIGASVVLAAVAGPHVAVALCPGKLMIDRSGTVQAEHP